MPKSSQYRLAVASQSLTTMPTCVSFLNSGFASIVSTPPAPTGRAECPISSCDLLFVLRLYNAHSRSPFHHFLSFIRTIVKRTKPPIERHDNSTKIDGHIFVMQIMHPMIHIQGKFAT